MSLLQDDFDACVVRRNKCFEWLPHNAFRYAFCHFAVICNLERTHSSVASKKRKNIKRHMSLRHGILSFCMFDCVHRMYVSIFHYVNLWRFFHFHLTFLQSSVTIIRSVAGGPKGNRCPVLYPTHYRHLCVHLWTFFSVAIHQNFTVHYKLTFINSARSVLPFYFQRSIVCCILLLIFIPFS